MVRFKKAAEGGRGLFGTASPCVNMARVTHSACTELTKKSWLTLRTDLTCKHK